MKKAFALIVFLGIVIVSEVKAQETPVVDGRQRAQRARIREGAASGDLTRGETAKLRSQQRHIRRTERRAVRLRAASLVTGFISLITSSFPLSGSRQRLVKICDKVFCIFNAYT
jgi:hypothetical protein